METYSKNHEALQAKLKSETQEAEAARNWLQFLRSHPELQFGGMANKSIFISYFGGDYPQNFSVAALEESYLNPELRKQLAIDDSSNTGDREKLLAELKEVFHGPQENWQNELAGTRYLTNDQIRAKIETLRAKHDLQKLDIPALREVVKSGTPPPVQEELPATYTRRMLVKELPPLDLRRLIDRYGRDAVNRRIAGIS